MKINLLKRLLIFSALTFLIITSLISGVSLFMGEPSWANPYFIPGLTIFYMGLLAYFLSLLKQAGIWIAHSLPSHIKFNSWPWLRTALAAFSVAILTFTASYFDWMPLVWRGLVVPLVSSICLFFFLWGILAPILSKTSRLQFSQLFAFLSVAPVLALIPLTGFFVSHSLVTGYFRSYPGQFNYTVDAIPNGIDEEERPVEKVTAPAYTTADYPLAESIQAIRTAVLTNTLCLDKKREVTRLLDNSTPEDHLFWAIKGVRCAELPSVIAIPRLVSIMSGAQAPMIRSSAILAIGRYSQNVIKNTAYLIIKRISSAESPEVIEAASLVLKKLGGADEKFVITRLRSILNPQNAPIVGNLLITYFQSSEEVAHFVVNNLQSSEEKARSSAIELICKLDSTFRPSTPESIQAVIKALEVKTRQASTMKAVACLGSPAFQAIERQVLEPTFLQRDVALSVYNSMSADSPDRKMDVLKSCVNDSNPKVRRLCAKGIGLVGATALPMILDLIKSSDNDLRETGQMALSQMKDQSVIEELKTLRDANSGWLSTASRLKTAESIQIAIARIEATTPGDSQVDR
jgi:HEAT repeat protein